MNFPSPITATFKLQESDFCTFPQAVKVLCPKLDFFFLWLPRPVKTAMVFPVKENGVENGSLRQKGLWSRERCCRDLCCT